MKTSLTLFLIFALVQGASAIKPGEKLIDVDGLINATYPCIASGNSIYIAADAPTGHSTCTFHYSKWVDNGGGGNTGGGGHKDTGPPDYINIWNPGMARNITTPITIPNPPRTDNQSLIVVAQPIEINLDGGTPITSPPQTVKEYVYLNNTIPGATITVEKPSPYTFWLILLAGVSLIGCLFACIMYLFLHKRHMELQEEHDRLQRK